MILSRRWIVLLLVGLCPTLFAAAAKKKSAVVNDKPAYKGAIVMDAATGNILFEDRADIVNPPASMTKLMTFAVLHERLAAGAVTLATPVKITKEDMGKGGTQVYLDPRETFPVEELVYAMMVHSANDAANALARAAAGSADAFVGLMNAKAAALGMKNTTFRTPHGLPPSNRKIADGDLTSPRDFALLSRYLVLQTDVLKYTSIRHRSFGQGVRKEAFEMKNHNNLLDKVAGVDGLKTGFTNGAGFCLSATALRNGRRVIVVTMGSEQATARDLKVTELLERGFAALPATTPPLPTPPPAAASPTIGDAFVIPAPRTAPASAPAAPAEPPVKFTVPKR